MYIKLRNIQWCFLIGAHVDITFSGRSYRVDGSGFDRAAFDSVYTSGVFHIEADDRLRVHLDMLSEDCIILDHEPKTFFGLFLVRRDVD